MTPTDIDLTRSRLAYMALAALIVFGLLAFVFGDKLSSTQIALLANIVTMIGSKAQAAFAYMFDGIAGKLKPQGDPPAEATPMPSTTASTTARQE
ncbi:MAG: hypothetical protein ACSLE9_11085 [Burkholderiaceae bacterium]